MAAVADELILEIKADWPYFTAMDTVNHDTGIETDAERKARMAWEAEGIAEAQAELDAGFYVDGDEMHAWLASIGTDHELPPPPTRRR